MSIEGMWVDGKVPVFLLVELDRSGADTTVIEIVRPDAR